MAFSETNTPTIPVGEGQNSPPAPTDHEVDPATPLVEGTAQDPESSNGVIREFAGKIAGKIITPHEVILQDAVAYKAAGRESLALMDSEKKESFVGIDPEYIEDLRGVTDIVDVDDRGVSGYNRQVKATVSGKGDGAQLSVHEVGMIAAHQDQIRYDVQVALSTPEAPSPTPNTDPETLTTQSSVQNAPLAHQGSKPPEGFDPVYARELNSIEDIINIDDRGVARHLKATPTRKGDGRYLSKHEVGMIAAHQDQIRNDVQVAPGTSEAPSPTPPAPPNSPPQNIVPSRRKVRPGEWVPPEPGTTEYDPTVLELHRSTHRTRRPVVGFGPDRITQSQPPVILSESTIAEGERTELQHQAEVRGNVRVDAIVKRKHEIARYLESYGDIILPGAVEVEVQTASIIEENDEGGHDAVTERRIYRSLEEVPKDELVLRVRTLKEVLAQERFTAAQKRDIKKAARKVKRALGTNTRLKQRLENSADGTDIPGTLVGLRSEPIKTKGQ